VSAFRDFYQIGVSKSTIVASNWQQHFASFPEFRVYIHGKQNYKIMFKLLISSWLGGLV
jgi:hypothetical protein